MKNPPLKPFFYVYIFVNLTKEGRGPEKEIPRTLRQAPRCLPPWHSRRGPPCHPSTRPRPRERLLLVSSARIRSHCRRLAAAGAPLKRIESTQIKRKMSTASPARGWITCTSTCTCVATHHCCCCTHAIVLFCCCLLIQYLCCCHHVVSDFCCSVDTLKNDDISNG